MSAKVTLLFVCLAVSNAQTLPIFFEPNRGQSSGDADFIARQGGRVSLLQGAQAELALGAVPVKMRFLQAARPAGVPFDRLPGSSNYLHGRDAASWRVGVPQYAGVRYSQLYDGVDLVYYSKDNR